MSFQTRYIFSASMDVSPESEGLFNEVYDDEHVPMLLKVPGVVAVSRLITEELKVAMGGEIHVVPNDGIPRYSAVYQIESPEVLTSNAWAAAVEQGRWPGQVRPHTSNRQHVLRKVIRPSEE